MKTLKILLQHTLVIVALVGTSLADSPPQPQVSFTEGTSGTWNADWSGVPGRSYFPQGSTDLVNWEFLPVIEFSDGPKGTGVSVDGSAKYFFRLRYTDEPTTDPELEDFAGDEIGSMIKVLMGLDPFVPLAWVDTDSDGIHDTIEQFWFGNLTGTQGGEDDANGNGIRDIFEIQAGNDPTLDLTGDTDSRSNYSYDPMGRLTGVTGGETRSYTFDFESNYEAIRE